MQIVNNVCEAVDPNGFGASQYTGITWPNDQWAEIQITAFSTNSICDLYLRCDNGFANFVHVDFSIALGIRVLISVGGIETVQQTFPAPPSIGDTIRVATIQSTWYVLKNGTLLGSGPIGPTPASGFVVLVNSYDVVPSDTTLDNFAGGGAINFFLIPLGSDPLTGSDVNPLPSPPWTEAVAGPVDAIPLEISNHQCVATAPPNIVAAEIFAPTGVTFPNDQYVSVKLAALVPLSTGGLEPIIRANADFSDFYILVAFDVGDGTQQIEFDFIVNNAAGGQIIISHGVNIISVGDVFTFGVLGTTVFALQNGVLIFVATETSIASGKPSLGLVPINNINDVAATNFVAGKVSLTPPPSGASLTFEREGFRLGLNDNGDGTVSILLHSGGPGVADQGLELEGFRIQLHDNGDGTFSPTITTSTGANDVAVEHEGFRFKLHPTGSTDPVTGEPMYAIVTVSV